MSYCRASVEICLSRTVLRLGLQSTRSCSEQLKTTEQLNYLCFAYLYIYLPFSSLCLCFENKTRNGIKNPTTPIRTEHRVIVKIFMNYKRGKEPLWRGKKLERWTMNSLQSKIDGIYPNSWCQPFIIVLSTSLNNIEKEEREGRRGRSVQISP